MYDIIEWYAIVKNKVDGMCLYWRRATANNDSNGLIDLVLMFLLIPFCSIPLYSAPFNSIPYCADLFFFIPISFFLLFFHLFSSPLLFFLFISTPLHSTPFHTTSFSSNLFPSPLSVSSPLCYNIYIIDITKDNLPLSPVK